MRREPLTRLRFANPPSPTRGEGKPPLRVVESDPQFTGLKLSVENSDCMICSFWFENRTPGPKLIGAMMPVSTFLVFSSSAMVQAQVGCLPQRSIAANQHLGGGVAGHGIAVDALHLGFRKQSLGLLKEGLAGGARERLDIVDGVDAVAGRSHQFQHRLDASGPEDADHRLDVELLQLLHHRDVLADDAAGQKHLGAGILQLQHVGGKVLLALLVVAAVDHVELLGLDDGIEAVAHGDAVIVVLGDQAPFLAGILLGEIVDEVDDAFLIGLSDDEHVLARRLPEELDRRRRR